MVTSRLDYYKAPCVGLPLKATQKLCTQTGTIQIVLASLMPTCSWLNIRKNFLTERFLSGAGFLGRWWVLLLWRFLSRGSMAICRQCWFCEFRQIMRGRAGRVVSVFGSHGPFLYTQGNADHHFGVKKHFSSRPDWPRMIQMQNWSKTSVWKQPTYTCPLDPGFKLFKSHGKVCGGFLGGKNCAVIRNLGAC